MTGIGPISPFTNPPVNPEYFQPSNFVVSSISPSGTQCSVITAVDNNYVLGQQVRFHIPSGWGIVQLNNVSAYVVQISSPTNFLVDLDIRFFNSFTTPVGLPAYQSPQVSAIGDQNFGVGVSLNALNSQITISGAFQNISP